MFQIYAAVNGCRIQCFWLSSSSQLCWAHRILRVSPTTMIFACPSFKNHGSAKSGSLQDDDPFQNPIGPLYRWAMSIGIRTRVDINSSINLNCLLNTLKAPNLPSIREYPSLSWCHFECFVSRHWFFVQATPTIQQLGKSTLDPPQEWLPIFSHNHGSVKNGYISNRIVTFQIQGPIFRWGRKGRTPSIPPNTPHTATPETLKQTTSGDSKSKATDRQRQLSEVTTVAPMSRNTFCWNSLSGWS